MKGKVVVGVPEQEAAVAQPGEVERVRDQRHDMRDMPLFTEDHHGLAPLDRRPDVFRQEGVGKALIDVGYLVVLAVVDTHGVISADPLAPAMQPEPAIERTFVRREGRITDKEQVGVEAALRQRPRQFLDANAEPAGLRVDIRAFEGQQNEGCLVRFEHQATAAPSSCSAYR